MTSPDPRSTGSELNITPGRRAVLLQVGAGEVVVKYHRSVPRPSDVGYITGTGRESWRLPRNVRSALDLLEEAGLLELPQTVEPTDDGRSLRRYQLTDAGRELVEDMARAR